MKRLAIAVLLVLSALLATSAHVSAAGIPLLSHASTGTVNPNDYSYYVESCTGSESLESCGVELAYNNSTAPLGPPTGGAFGCIRYTSTGYQEIVALYGNYYGGAFGTGTVGGVTGFLSSTALFSNLVAKSNLTDEGYAGAVTGVAIGTLKFAPTEETDYYTITGGKITLSLRGAIANVSNDSETITTTQGSMTCTISASNIYGYVATPYYIP